jgi:hypothetical protein
VAALLKKAEEKAAQEQQLAEAGKLALMGLVLLQQKKWAEAEPLLRPCLAIRAKMQPNAWTTFNTRSMLGGALLAQKTVRRRRSAAAGRLPGDEETRSPDPAARQAAAEGGRGATGATL